VFPVDVVHRVGEVFQLVDDLLDAVKVVVSFLNASNWSGQTFQRVHLLLQLVEVMAGLDVLPHGIGHILESVDLLCDLLEIVLSVDLVHRIVERLEIGKILFNL